MKWEEAIQRFKIDKIYQESDVEALPPSLSKVLKEWCKNPQGKSLYLNGNTGSGKTYASIAILKEILNQKKYRWVIYVRSDDLDEELLRACENKHEATVIEKYQEAEVLFLDDLGVERPTDRVVKQYYSIIDRRLNNLRPTVFTSNISVQNINKILGDRIASRLQLTSQIIFPNKDYRKGM